VSSTVLATTLARKSSGRVDGFVIEGRTAGGHNAPPRGDMQLSELGEPVYGPRDLPDLPRFVELGLPFWLAGSFGRPGGLEEARRLGAAGIQVGTAFAFCEESGIMPELKREAIRLSRAGKASVFTDPVASPTGFPFKVVRMGGTLSEPELYEARSRLCDVGYRRHPYRRADGTVGYRCPAEPFADFIHKGGTMEEARGRKCLCNTLPATAGLGQTRSGGEIELPLVTAGNDVTELSQFIAPDRDTYTAEDVLHRLLGNGAGEGGAP
jgi:nitronate monooxygenase